MTTRHARSPVPRILTHGRHLTAVLLLASGLIAGILLLSFAPAPAARAQLELTVGTSPDFEPFEYYSGEDIVGYDIDLMNAVAADLGRTPVYVPVPFADLLTGLAGGSFEAAVSGLSIVPEREEQVDFTIPYLLFANQPLGMAIQQGDSDLRRALNESLWWQNENGTLETVRAGVDAYFSGIEVSLPDWPLVSAGQQELLTFTNSRGTVTAVLFPAGAVAEPTMVTLTPIQREVVPGEIPLLAQPFEVDAYRDGVYVETVSFLTAASVHICYAPEDIAGLDETRLVLLIWNEQNGRWQDAACGAPVRNPESNMLTVPICRTGRFAFVEATLPMYLPVVLARQAE